MGKFHKRENYEMLYRQLKMDKSIKLDYISDYTLMQKINAMLKAFGCITYTNKEILDIAEDMSS